MRVLDPQTLGLSSVVANCAMNRERRLSGSNSYRRELGLDILAFLRSRLSVGPVAWADLCCGSGLALIEAAASFADDPDKSRVQIEGIDLAGYFNPNPYPDLLSLREQMIEAWIPIGPYSLRPANVHGPFRAKGAKLPCPKMW